MLNIEHKEDSTAKLEAVQGKPSKNFLFAGEVNQIVQEVNNLEATINPDRIISLGTETIDVNEYTYEGYTWQLNGVQINNIGNPSIIVIPSATIGYKRNDISVFKADGTIERIAGTETNGEVVSTPDVPEGTLFYKSYSVNGNDIDAEPEPPAIDGTIYKKKIENTRWKSLQSGSNVVIPFQAAGQSHYSVVHSGLVSVAGFSTALLTTPMYEGQDVLFENQTGNPITLKDSFAGVNTPFDLGADLVVPNEGKIWFRSRNGLLEMIMKSWSDDKDVIEGYFNGTNFYTDALFTNLITPESGRIYINIAVTPATQYRWSGSAYVQIGGFNKQIFFTPGAKYGLDTISSCYSNNVETGFASALINSPAGNMPTAMGVRWVLPLFISEKNQKLKEVNIRITNATFTTLRLVIFTGLSVNGSNLRINNQIIHDQNYTLSGGNLSLQKITSFTNDVTIPIGYDLCFFLIRVDGTTGTLSNFQIYGYAY